MKVDFARVRRVLLPRAGGQQLLNLSLEAVGLLPCALLGSTAEKNSQMKLLHGIATTEGFSRNRPARISLRRLETELGQRTTEKNQIKSV